ncbi:MAG: hypothetical protein ACREK4_21915 [Candidatus Rokuibacteriota bacterium]
MKKVRIETPYPSPRSTAKALGVTKERMRQLAALVDLLLGKAGKGTRKAASIRRAKPPRGTSITAKRARPAAASAASR